MSLNSIVLAQQHYPLILIQPLAFFLVFVAGCAEINRSPFDLMEADSEIVAGFHTEYTGMKFAMFYLAEYGEAVVMSTVISTLFLGGWQGPLCRRGLGHRQGILRVFPDDLDKDNFTTRQNRPVDGAGMEIPLPAGAD